MSYLPLPAAVTMSPESPTSTAYDRWARYYDLAEGDRQPYLAFYASLLRPSDCSVLEIGCGTGIIADALARRIAAAGKQARVVGLDASAPMLELARERYPDLDWVHGDMRELPVEGRFDLLFCCFNSFQFMLGDADLARAFQAAREHVEADGQLAFDLYQPNLPYLRQDRRDTLARRLQHEGRELQIREDSWFDEDRLLLDLYWRLVDSLHPDEALAATHFRIRQYFPEVVERLLSASGWRIVGRYGDLQRAAFTAQSKKQVLVCAPA